MEDEIRRSGDYEAQEFRALEDENRRLKQLVADQALDNQRSPIWKSRGTS